MIPGKSSGCKLAATAALSLHFASRLASTKFTMPLAIGKTLRFLVLSVILLGGVVVRAHLTRIVTETFTDQNHHSRMKLSVPS